MYLFTKDIERTLSLLKTILVISVAVIVWKREFENKSFCLSGNFEYGSKAEVAEYITSKGGLIDKGVKKTTNYLVVGEEGSSRYSNGNYGTKVKKALETGVIVLKENQLFNV